MTTFNKAAHKKDLIRFADQIRASISERPDWLRDPESKVSFSMEGTTFKVSCLDKECAVVALADKIQKKAGTSFFPSNPATKKPGIPSRSVWNVVKDFVSEGQMDNALEYMRLNDVTPLYAKGGQGNRILLVDVTLFTERGYEFAISRAIDNELWRVTHLRSGYSLGSAQKDKAGALKIAREVLNNDSGKLVERLNQFNDKIDYQAECAK